MISTARGIRPTPTSGVGGLGGLDVAEDQCNSDDGSLFGDDDGMNNNEPLAEDPAAEELFQAWPADTADGVALMTSAARKRR